MPSLIRKISDYRMERLQVHRVSVADQVAGILRQRILAGELRPGTALPEVSVSAALGVSRNTLREAVRILALEGLLKRDIHRGVSVSHLSIADVEEIYRLRRMLEIPAVYAARKPSVEILRQMRSLVDEYEAVVHARNWVRAVGVDFQFHTQLIRFHRNNRLESFYQKLIGELRMGMVLVDRVHDDPGGLIPVHREICELLAAGELRKCAVLLAQHLDDSEARLRDIVSRYADLRRVRTGT
ncbi:MAG: GntR family transcriptional regulator [Acidobacteriia bacterium]|nr:GntR family transcriptional regulator [Terriglobia bacterium]